MEPLIGQDETQETDAEAGLIPTVSIVVPAFNRAQFLDETLRSISSQTFARWECVVVDDGSTDITLEIARQHASRDGRIRAFRTANAGASAARNFGYLQTDRRSRFVTFMDSDDVWLPHALETLYEAASADPLAAGAHALAEMIDAHGCPLEPGAYSDTGRRRLGVRGKTLQAWSVDEPTDFAVLINGNVLFPPGLLLVRRSIYETVGRFDESLRAAEDWDMLIRVSRHGAIRFVNEVILLYRMHRSNLGSQRNVPRDAWQVRCKGFHSPENTPEHVDIARRGWRAYQKMMMSTRAAEARAALADRSFRRALASVLRLPVHAIRLARGYPMPKIVRTDMPWDGSREFDDRVHSRFAEDDGAEVAR
jgi:glycosyltransferase involved in cell wall biosynthesis